MKRAREWSDDDRRGARRPRQDGGKKGKGRGSKGGKGGKGGGYKGGATSLVKHGDIERYGRSFFGDIGSAMRCNKEHLEKSMDAGVWVSRNAIVSEEDRKTLAEELGQELERRGQRQLRWYGANWPGRGELQETSPMPPKSQAIVDELCKKVGFPKVTVSTLHVYTKSRALRGSAEQLSEKLEGRRMAIVPHTDDVLLTGNGGVMMLQVTGDSDVAMVRRGRQGEPAEYDACVPRPLGHVLVCEGDAFQRPYQHSVLWHESDPDEATMMTLTMRSIALPWMIKETPPAEDPEKDKDKDMPKEEGAAEEKEVKDDGDTATAADAPQSAGGRNSRSASAASQGRGDKPPRTRTPSREPERRDDRRPRTPPRDDRRPCTPPRDDRRPSDYRAGGGDRRIAESIYDSRRIPDTMYDDRRNPSRHDDRRPVDDRRDFARGGDRRDDRRIGDDQHDRRFNDRRGDRRLDDDRRGGARDGRPADYRRDGRGDERGGRPANYRRDGSRDRGPRGASRDRTQQGRGGSRDRGAGRPRDYRDQGRGASRERGQERRVSRDRDPRDDPRGHGRGASPERASGRPRDYRGQGRGASRGRDQRDSSRDRGQERRVSRDRDPRGALRGQRGASPDRTQQGRGGSRDRGAGRPRDYRDQNRGASRGRDQREASQERGQQERGQQGDASRDGGAGRPRDYREPPAQRRARSRSWSWEFDGSKVRCETPEPLRQVSVTDLSYTELRELYQAQKHRFTMFREQFKDQNGQYPRAKDLEHPSLARLQRLYKRCLALRDQKAKVRDQKKERRHRRNGDDGGGRRRRDADEGSESDVGDRDRRQRRTLRGEKDGRARRSVSGGGDLSDY